jgi:hypothetical protein
MTTVKEDGGRLNMYAIEVPPMEIMEVNETHNEKAELWKLTPQRKGLTAALQCLVSSLLLEHTQQLVNLSPEYFK